MTKSKMANRYLAAARQDMFTCPRRRGPRACSAGGIRASRLLRNASGRDRGHCTEDRLYSPDLARRVRQAEKDSGMRDGVTTGERDRIKAPER